MRKTSIIILSYNTLSYTKFCIESIRAYTRKNSYEIIVVDNASTDGSLEWLKEKTHRQYGKCWFSGWLQSRDAGRSAGK